MKTSSRVAGLFKNTWGNPSKYRMRMRIEIPINDLIKKLAIHKFVVFDYKNMPKATARKGLVNFSHNEILSFYNSRVQGLLAFYSFAANLTSLRKIIMLLHLSCALTLALKYKLRTKRAVFKKFGRTLMDPETNVKLIRPRDLKVKHLFRGTETSNPNNNLKTSRFKKITKSGLHQKCVICNSVHQIEMHHTRKIKDARNKIRTGNSTYAQWTGAYKPKQVPLCAYHHDLLHRGDLNHSDTVLIRNYLY